MLMPRLSVTPRLQCTCGFVQPCLVSGLDSGEASEWAEPRSPGQAAEGRSALKTAFLCQFLSPGTSGLVLPVLGRGFSNQTQDFRGCWF